MARYYGEQHTQYDDEYRRVKKRTQANTLLQRNVWLGQVQGRGSLSTQSRHLRPLCEPVSSAITDVDAQPKNLVLYVSSSVIENGQQLTRDRCHIFTGSLTGNVITSRTTSTRARTKSKSSCE